MSGTDPARGLNVRDLTVRFGGTVAVDNVSLSAPLGRCTGLIGPNGAGKSTILNAVYGIVASAHGTVELFGRPLNRLEPSRRARRGLARSFQQVQLFDTMTVAENVRMGREASRIGGHVFRSVWRSPAARRDADEVVEQALELCGIADLRHELTRSLPTGQRRLVEFARAAATPATMFLLDEPASGLDRAETARFGEVLRTVVAERGAGVLLVEHDMSLVSAVCEQVHVLDFGTKIFAGPMADARQDDRVRKAYLGLEPVAAGGEERVDA